MSEANIERLLYGGPTPRVKLRRRAIMLAVFVAATTGAYVAGEADAHGLWCKLTPKTPYFSQGVVKGIAQLNCSEPHYYAEVKIRLIRTPVYEEKYREESNYHDARHGGQAVDWIYTTTQMPCYRNWQYKVMAWGQAGNNGRHNFGPMVSEPVVLC